MGTLASELGPHAGRIAGQPRLYVDANVPAGLVTYMRTKLQWDVLFVIEHDECRPGLRVAGADDPSLEGDREHYEET